MFQDHWFSSYVYVKKRQSPVKYQELSPASWVGITDAHKIPHEA